MVAKYYIPEIHCSSCVMLLEEIEDEIEFVNNIKVDPIRKTATIEFDESKINSEELIEAIENISGYKAVPYV
ncbi:heavy-metal-associated domain-containing protein [Candidatus Berkelbacteria bacterium]|nr:heavy-metal-associated domain-containing protein [Candidatus Berkelbacteria bacterium]